MKVHVHYRHQRGKKDPWSHFWPGPGLCLFLELDPGDRERLLEAESGEAVLFATGAWEGDELDAARAQLEADLRVRQNGGA